MRHCRLRLADKHSESVICAVVQTYPRTGHLATISRGDERPRPALAIDDRLWAIEDLTAGHPSFPMPHASVLEMLEHWDDVLPALDRLAEIARGGAPSLPMHTCTIHPPVDAPRQIFCAGANYRQHVIDITLDMGAGPEDLEGEALRCWAETMMDERARNGEPYVLMKPLGALAGAFDAVEVPTPEVELDWELELAVIIGRKGYRIDRSNAVEPVAGYAVANDLSARQLIRRKDYPQLGTDWFRAKGQKSFLPLGPYLVPAKFVPDPEKLAMRLSVDDVLMQNACTDDMVFGIARLIEYISASTRCFPATSSVQGRPQATALTMGASSLPVTS